MAIDLTGWTETSGSGSRTGDKTEYVYCAIALEEHSDPWASLKSDYEAGTGYGSGYIDFEACRLVNQGPMLYLYIAVRGKERPGGMEVNYNNGDKTYNIEMGELAKPLSSCANYLVNWEYDLYGKYLYNPLTKEFSAYDGSGTVPDFWDTLTARSSMTVADAAKFRWSKETPPDDTQPDGRIFRWFLLMERTKPGVESRPVPAPVVVERAHYKRKSLAEAAVAGSHALAAPAVTYGLPSDASHWLRRSGGIEYDGTYYSAITRYTYADEWDADIYAPGD